MVPLAEERVSESRGSYGYLIVEVPDLIVEVLDYSASCFSYQIDALSFRSGSIIPVTRRKFLYPLLVGFLYPLLVDVKYVTGRRILPVTYFPTL